MTIVDLGIGSEDIQLSVEFVPVDRDMQRTEISSLIAVLKSVAKESPVDKSAEIDEMLAKIGRELRFEARPYFVVNEKIVDEKSWFAAKKKTVGFYQLPNGIMVTRDLYEKMTDLFILRQRVYAKFKSLTLAQIWSVHQTTVNQASRRLDIEDYVRQLSLRLTTFLDELDHEASILLTEQLMKSHLPDLVSVMRPYQKEGTCWSYLRAKLGLGICLADEMGLGKTLQAIALLRLLHRQDIPSLVVMPKTLLINWQREFASFGGPLRIAFYDESPAKGNYDILLLTYPRLRMHIKKVSMERWNVKVTVTTTDGRVLAGRVDEPKGDPGNTLSRQEITDKAMRLAAYSGGAKPEAMRRAVTALWQVVAWPRVGSLLS
jgi:SNF2 family DNA or RNA helicase